MFLRLFIGFTLCCGNAHGAPDDNPKAALMQIVGEYQPGMPVTPELAAKIDAAAAELESDFSAPDLAQNLAQLDGIWINLYSSQGIIGEIDIRFMTRALPGGGQSGGKAAALTVLQELHPEQRFYRNMMTMTAGDDALPFLYIATADLGISEVATNDLEVSFHTIAFVPARADVSLSQLRAALGLAEDTPLEIRLPSNTGRAPSTSTVTFLDEDLRINRGKDYIAILRRLQ